MLWFSRTHCRYTYHLTFLVTLTLTVSRAPQDMLVVPPHSESVDVNIPCTPSGPHDDEEGVLHVRRETPVDSAGARRGSKGGKRGSKQSAQLVPPPRSIYEGSTLVCETLGEESLHHTYQALMRHCVYPDIPVCTTINSYPASVYLYLTTSRSQSFE